MSKLGISANAISQTLRMQHIFVPSMQRAKVICSVLTLSLLFPMIPMVHAADTVTITCDSDDFSHKRCDIENKGVRLVKTLSVSDCRQGRDWGYDKRGIWVDHGCEGQFEVTKNGEERSDATAAALLIGALVVGAAAMASHDDAETRQGAAAKPPNWAIGSYRGRHPVTQRFEELKIDANGSVQLVRQGQLQQSRWLDGNRFSVGSENYQLERASGAIRVGVNGVSKVEYLLLD